MSVEAPPSRVYVGSVAEFGEGDRRLVSAGTTTVGVFRVDDGFVAYENLCLHQGGPACEGRLFPRIVAEVTDEGRVVAERHDRETPHLVCPWHGWEYDLRTGVFAGDRSRRLRSFDVEVEGNDVYVTI